MSLAAIKLFTRNEAFLFGKVDTAMCTTHRIFDTLCHILIPG